MSTINGTVCHQGVPMENATIAVFLYENSSDSEVAYTTTDQHGYYEINTHPDGGQSTKKWLVNVYKQAGNDEYTAEACITNAQIPTQ